MAHSERPAERGRRWLRVALTLAGVALFANVLRGADLPSTLAAIARVGPRAAIALGPFVISAVLHTFAWQRFFPPAKRPSLRALFAATLSMEALLLTAPGGAIVAEGAGPFLVRARAGKSGPTIAEVVAAQAAKKCAIVLSNSMYLSFALTVGGAYLANTSRVLFGSAVLVTGVAICAAALFAGGLASFSFLARGALAERIHRLLLYIPWARVRAFLEPRRSAFLETDEHLAAALSKANVAIGTILCLIGWLVDASETWLILRLLGANASYAEVISFEVVASLVRSIAFFLPGGVGVQDMSYAGLIGAAAIGPPGLGVAFVVAKRAKELVWVGIGYVVLLTTPRAAEKDHP